MSDGEGFAVVVDGSASRPSGWDLGPPTVPEGDRLFAAATDHGHPPGARGSGRGGRAMIVEDKLSNRNLP